jgi:hypothetical protein
VLTLFLSYASDKSGALATHADALRCEDAPDPIEKRRDRRTDSDFCIGELELRAQFTRPWADESDNSTVRPVFVLEESAMASGQLCPQASAAPKVNCAQLELVDLSFLDKLNQRKIFAQLLKTFTVDARIDALGGGYYSSVSLKSTVRIFRLLERSLRLLSHSSNIVRIVPKDRYPILNRTLSFYVSRLPIPGQTKNELRWLAHRMRLGRCGLVGDIVQMSRAKILLHACAVPSVRNPEKLAAQLEKLLARIGFSLDMTAPGWVRVEPPTMSEQIAERDERNEAAARRKATQSRRPPHLMLVPP